jgi:predicted Zn-dependent peptidase
MESTSNRMSRLGKAVITDSELLSLDRILAEIEGVDHESVCTLARLLLPPEKLSVAAIGPSEERFVEAVERLAPSLVSARAA